MVKSVCALCERSHVQVLSLLTTFTKKIKINKNKNCNNLGYQTEQIQPKELKNYKIPYT